jgi:murein L,D-transpeptidase YcbB/YkuD
MEDDEPYREPTQVAEQEAQAGNIARELQRFLQGEIAPKSDRALIMDALRNFYSARDYQPVWCLTSGPQQRARALQKILAMAGNEGLNPSDYDGNAFEWYCASAHSADRAWADLLLSNAFLEYSGDLYAGRLDPARVGTEWYITPPEVNRTDLLQRFLQAQDPARFLHELVPSHPAYLQLRTALKKYQNLLKAGDWPTLSDGPLIRPGERHASIPVLRERLFREGAYTPPPAITDPEQYDSDLATAVKRFQQRYGLKEDGIIGAHTRQALNVSLPTRIEQLKLNMERWRWMPRTLETRYLHVNLASFELQLVEQGQTLLRMRTITGRRDRTTPVFRGRMNRIVINPTWTVPFRIAVEDLLPEQLEDPDYLVNKQIDVFQRIDGERIQLDPNSIDWSQYSKNYFPFQLRQRAGSHNALGRIKFLFPNRFDIYLHDTPNHRLFQEPVRTFSSGCIRVEQPAKLATALLQLDEATVLETIDSEETVSHRLQSPIPVYLVYMTAWVDDRGVVHFRDDVYGRDLQLAEYKQRKSWQ